MRKLFILIASGFAAAMPGLPAAAQQSAPAAQMPRLDARAVVAHVREIIGKRWVLAQHRPRLDTILAKALASGRYDVTDPAVLAERIDEDLKRIGHDRHLGFEFDREAAATIAARDYQEDPDPSAFERQTRLANHGVSELRLLHGNVRYMAYDQFWWMGPESATALDGAIRFLAGGDAIVIDLRRNGGGFPDPVRYLISHFMPARQLLSTFYDDGEIKRGYTFETLPAGRVIGKPLYVLVSPNTASAAEALAGMVKGHRLGEVVGETTAGAGLSNELVPIGGRFVLSISTARVVLASTGTDWEAVGISPTIRTPAAQALEAAYLHALRRIAANAPPQERPGLEASAEVVAARLEPRQPALPLTAYEGTFGERNVILEGRSLYYQRGSGDRVLLVALGGDLFAFDSDPTLRLAFVKVGKKINAITVHRTGEPPQGTYERTR
jgi:hypothetical protein